MHRIAIASLALLLTTPATAQQRVCAPTAQMIERLDKGFGERLSAAGLGANGSMVAVYSNPESGSWTITVTTPDKVSCVVSSGEGFVIETPEPPRPRGEVS
jgi:hypothetical protein